MSNYHIPCQDVLKVIFGHLSAIELTIIAQVCKDFNIAAIAMHKSRSCAKDLYNLRYSTVTNMINNYNKRLHKFDVSKATTYVSCVLETNGIKGNMYGVNTPEYVHPYLDNLDTLRAMMTDYYLICKYNLPVNSKLIGYCPVDIFHDNNIEHCITVNNQDSLVYAHFANNKELIEELSKYEDLVVRNTLFKKACAKGYPKIMDKYIDIHDFNAINNGLKIACRKRDFYIVEMLFAQFPYIGEDIFEQVNISVDNEMIETIYRAATYDPYHALINAVLHGYVYTVSVLYKYHTYNDIDNTAMIMNLICDMYLDDGNDKIIKKFQILEILCTNMAELRDIHLTKIFPTIDEGDESLKPVYEDNITQLVDWFISEDMSDHRQFSFNLNVVMTKDDGLKTLYNYMLDDLINKLRTWGGFEDHIQILLIGPKVKPKCGSISICYDIAMHLLQYLSVFELANIASVCSIFNKCAIDIRKARSKSECSYDMNYLQYQSIKDSYYTRSYKTNTIYGEAIEIITKNDGIENIEYILDCSSPFDDCASDVYIIKDMMKDHYLICKYKLPIVPKLMGLCSVETIEQDENIKKALIGKYHELLVYAYLDDNKKLIEHLYKYTRSTIATFETVFIKACKHGKCSAVRNGLDDWNEGYLSGRIMKIGFKKACKYRQFTIIREIAQEWTYHGCSAIRKVIECGDDEVLFTLNDFTAYNAKSTLFKALCKGNLHVIKILCEYDELEEDLFIYMGCACSSYYEDDSIIKKFQAIEIVMKNIHNLNAASFKDLFINIKSTEIELICNWFTMPEMLKYKQEFMNIMVDDHSAYELMRVGFITYLKVLEGDVSKYLELML